ncbi:hypothetical protein BBJ28_00002972 [Nothophytophthora sp. Chile5]|nr:hypothetical protein BBJ28_00002972 [Nothophytophthora sp. Chile5]
MSKKGKPKAKTKAAVVDENAVTRQILVSNYGKTCNLLPAATSGVSIAYLELLDCGIGEPGCTALSHVLRQQTMLGLLTLNLNCNLALGDAGVAALVHGLFTNTVVGDDGLRYLSLGLARSHRLTTLNLSDNGIRDVRPGFDSSFHRLKLRLTSSCASKQNVEALTAFRDALIRSKALANVDFTFNQIEPEGAHILLPALAPENAKLLSFLVDASLPGDLFQQLNRASKAEGKKKGGKKGGGKKKK